VDVLKMSVAMGTVLNILHSSYTQSFVLSQNVIANIEQKDATKLN